MVQGAPALCIGTTPATSGLVGIYSKGQGQHMDRQHANHHRLSHHGRRASSLPFDIGLDPLVDLHDALHTDANDTKEG